MAGSRTLVRALDSRAYFANCTYPAGKCGLISSYTERTLRPERSASSTRDAMILNATRASPHLSFGSANLASFEKPSARRLA